MDIKPKFNTYNPVFDFKKLDPNFIYFIRYTKPELGKWIFGPSPNHQSNKKEQTGIHTIIREENIVDFTDSITGITAYYVRAEIVSEKEFFNFDK